MPVFVVLLCAKITWRLKFNLPLTMFSAAWQQSSTVAEEYKAPIKEENFYSLNVDDNFKLFISVPEGYDKEDSIQYPVIYVLEGNVYAEDVSQIAYALHKNGELKEIQ